MTLRQKTMCMIQMCDDIIHVYYYSFVIWQDMCCVCFVLLMQNAKFIKILKINK